MTDLRRDEHTQDITAILVPQLTEMMELPILQKFQDTFARSFHVAMVIRDADGTPVTSPTLPTPFAVKMLKALKEDDAYEENTAALARKSVASGRIEQRRDRFGFLQFAVPVTVQERPVGAFVVYNFPDEQTDETLLQELAHEVKLSPGEIRKRSGQHLGHTMSLLRFAAEALADICHEAWIVRRHVSELRTLQMVSQMLISTRDLDELLDLIVRTVVDTLKVKACGLRLLKPESGELVVAAVYGLSDEYLKKGPVSLKRSSIDQAAMAGEPIYIKDIATDGRILYPAEMMAEGIRSNLVIGLKVRNRPIGALRIYTGEKRYFHQSEIALAEAIANLSAIAIENAKLNVESLEKERLEYELGLAAQIQAHLLPQECPHPDHFDICAVNEPCRQVGGDFFDYLVDPYTNRLGIVIADVCGKSMAGALLMATARSALRVQAEHCTTAAEIVTRANMSLCRDTRPEEFVTLFFAKLDIDRRVLHYANAGHSPPVLFRGDETIRLEDGGMVCGVLPENTYHESDVQLEIGDVLLLYTDGLDEARNRKEELFGLERAEKIIRDHRDKPASEIVHLLQKAVHRFMGAREQTDDLTLILIKVI